MFSVAVWQGSGRPVADSRMLFDVFEQGICGPTVAGGVPMAVVGPTRICKFVALAEDVVGLVDDGDVEGCGDFTQPLEYGGSAVLQPVCSQDD